MRDLLFFFSSRRRHTRSKRDWSSDVCSSDLPGPPAWTGRLQNVINSGPTSLSMQVAQDAINGARLAAVADCYFFLYAGRSEERRVGKESRCRRAPEQYRKQPDHGTRSEKPDD